jgi:polar amino acid transport system substrate-binding protein
MKKTVICMSVLLVLSLSFGCAHIAGKSASPVLDIIREKGELVVGTAGNMPPFNMTTKEGKQIGFDIDLAQYISKAMDVKLRIETIPFSNLLPALKEEKIDMIISSMTITPKRNLDVAFVGPYFISGKGFLTKTETIASAQDPSEIDSSDTKVAALRGSTSYMFVEKFMPKVQLVATRDYDEAIDMVIQDKVHALVADYPVCIVALFRHPDKGLRSVVTPFTYEPLGIAVSNNDPHLVNWLKNFLSTLKGSGELKRLQDRWFEDGSWLKELMKWKKVSGAGEKTRC